MNWFAKYRLEWIKEIVQIYGFINREHIAQKFDLSIVQASGDIKAFMEKYPGFLKYDPRSKRYLLEDNSVEEKPEISAPENLEPDPRNKASYVGVPAIFQLELECKHINRAFNGFGCYLVGSALHSPNWRDVDIVYIMEDDEFDKLFPNAGENTCEFDERWLLFTVSISERLSRISGVPVDFKIQRQSHANKKHDKDRHAMGLTFTRPNDE